MQINIPVQNQRASSAKWKEKNPVLLAGQIGYEKDTRKQKIGDGTTAWNNLPYSTTTPEDLADHADSTSHITSTDRENWNGKEPAIPAGTSGQYYSGAKKWESIEAAVASAMDDLVIDGGDLDVE